jgi:hypothetical protein
MERAHLDATGQTYAMTARDPTGLARLASSPLTDDEILRRWEIALGSSGFDKPTDIFDFASKVNRYARNVVVATKLTGTTDSASYDWSDGGGFNELNRTGGAA